MSGQRLFEIWAPADAPWTPWAKPVLFAHMPERCFTSECSIARAELPCKVPSDIAIIIDAPGALSVQLGLAAARGGHRPVPLYNTTPGPSPAVDCDPIMHELAASGNDLAKMRIEDEASPAFLLDADRMSGKRTPGGYDNRWMVFEQDFPSATFLKSRGIRSVMVIRQSQRAIGADLLKVLSRWRKDGMEIIRPAERSGRQEPLEFSTSIPRRITTMLALLGAGLWFNSAGGFGSRVPMPSEGGGYS